MGSSGKKHAIIFNGDGSSTVCITQTEQMIKRHRPNLEILLLSNVEEIIHALDTLHVVVFILPGGRDIPYHCIFREKLDSRIYRYVYDQGGSYLGICAGAYYATGVVNFEPDRPDYKVCDQRNLKFYDGTSVGSFFLDGQEQRFEYGSERGAWAARITTSLGTWCYSYFNGGCYFTGASHAYETLGVYEETNDKKPAVVKTNVGRGIAILSGVHFEFDEKALLNISPTQIDPHIAINIMATAAKRQEWIEFIFDQLRL